MDCIYFIYSKYCDKFSSAERQLYGYSDLTEHICQFKDCPEKCKNYVKERGKNVKSN